MASSGCAFSFAVRAGRVEALACWFDTHAWGEGGGRESPGMRVTFFCFAKRKSPKKRRPPVCDPFAVRRGKPAAVRLRGAPWNSLCAGARRSDSHGESAHEAWALRRPCSPRNRPAAGAASRGGTSEHPNSQHPFGPLLRSASSRGRKSHALRKLGRAKQRPEWMFCSPCPSGCAEERRVWRIRARDCLSEVKRSEFERDPAKPGHRRLPRSEAQGTQTVGSPFLWFLSFGDAKERDSHAGRLPASALNKGMRPYQRTQPNTTKSIAASAYPTSAPSQKHQKTTRRAPP